jgi:hypothetical protein
MTTTATKLLNFDAVEKAPLTTEPFSFMVAKDVIPADMLARVNADYPHIDRPANFKPESLTYGPLFAQVLEDLDSPEFERMISRKFDIDLSQTTKTITVRKLSEPSDGNIRRSAARFWGSSGRTTAITATSALTASGAWCR